ncbi:GmrSD restriction endonuclease domain-containing protein [Serratia proteamaculans]|uniref:GmrSD restriction endonuclease domain-containing protein n=1 Tax=Serratia proteamaculans TaxID=28151 RepID=UPI00217B0F00|nr:DUF262 domain-containing protein [Serratia proteamaculans]CAI1804502.1 Protein of uncharacterised function DUF262 [Serratia proteamaculans]
MIRKASELQDSRINAINILSEMTIGDYCQLVDGTLKNNVFQRKRVKSSKTVYSLLKKDLLRECVIPPVVLALMTSAEEYSINVDFSDYINNNKDHLIILDGLQRTYTIFDLVDEIRTSGDEESLTKLLGNKIRVEFYIGLNKIGILYRMLTLNTGQTPMSLRQQIEILYLDYLNIPVDGVQLVRESDGGSITEINQYNFKDVVEGFNSYLDRDELPIEKADILENINSLEKLSRENQDQDLFRNYLKSWHTFIERMYAICGNDKISDEYKENNPTPFGADILHIFKKPQALSGFGAAIGKMVDFNIISDFSDVNSTVGDLNLDKSEVSAFIEEINTSLNWLKMNAKKIGNAQRTYFTFFFRDLLNKESDSHANLIEASKSALRKYQSINF